MPNAFAYLVLFSWPLVAIWIFNKKPRQDAVILLVLVPFLLLPERVSVDLPGLPSLDKKSIPILTLFLLVAFGKDKISFFSLPKDFLGKVLLICLFLYPVATWFWNRDSYPFGPLYFPGLTFMGDVISMEFISFCSQFLPFFIGWKLLGNEVGHQKLMRYLLIGGLIYSIPMLWEIRMSPQLHTHIYGFFPHDFVQMMRQGGFRPIVFTSHGLVLAMLCAYWCIIAAAFIRAKDPLFNKHMRWIFLYLLVLLVLCKTLGALILALVFLPCVLLLRQRKILQISAILAYVVLLYPLLRAEGLFPIHGIVELSERFSEDRAQSFQYRVTNEERLLARVEERKLFGWGGWGRNRVYDERTGEDITVTDGFWIIVLGIYGWFGYLVVFGLLVYPIISIWRRVKKTNEEVSIYTCALVVILTMNLLDLLPNSSISSITWLLAGALYGFKEKMGTTAVKPKSGDISSSKSSSKLSIANR
ncbi:MAG TPA: O-antigen ligase family protein [Marinagarivorans sp.]